jgi:hypothetical protein
LKKREGPRLLSKTKLLVVIGEGEKAAKRAGDVC